MGDRPYVIAISEEMQHLCFPDGSWEELLALYPFAVIRSLAEMGEEEWIALCREADILAGPWGMRPFPDTDDPSDLPQYLCYVGGAVSGFLTERHLQLGMRVTNWGDCIADTIAESALMGILACLRRVGYHQHVTHQARGWRVPGELADSASLLGKRVGLIGLGQIARALVSLVRPFGVALFAYDPYVPDAAFAQYGVTRVGSLEELFRTCPIITNHAGRVPELAGRIDRAMLRLLPDDGLFVNTARGQILVEEDLAAEHQAGRLWSCLDVFEPEPPAPDNPLRDTPRCLITPHQAGPTKDRYHCMGRRAIENLTRWRAGEPLLGEVTAEMLPRMT
ncbi:MAG: hydroxyacid dehydrogenase [Armatimonadetes bacterium]|nr:hydroxyacid dehydrogenase [Armatimonadota bacterium]